ncbi:VanZ family protein [Actinophytocola gossypii]|uniref:VanZ family protein n=1 Tax=Actinophytocola gossypii TaxID=2812003 RepID=A0ABT2JG55_9PSEU|nr:VanZ family protein [Actinophytocola gossypii]MCT2586853.1 VanZ family protein [Actinophytocola gossypii]
MITNFLLEHSALVPVALVLVALACVGVGLAVRRSGGRVRWLLAGVSLLPVVALTLVPTPGRVFSVCAVQFSVPTLGSVELLANVALFVPPVYFTTLATARPLLTLALATTLSAAIEALQALLPTIGRACDTNDWAMNTAGSVIAVLLARATLALTRRRSRDPRSDTV